MPTIANNELFNRIVDRNNLCLAYRKTLQGDEKYTIEAMRFAADEVYNLKELRGSLIDETYTFDGYISFPVFEPKERIIDAPHFKDKIVQLAMMNVLKEIYNPCFIYDSYACIDGKGTHRCADRIQKFMRRARWEYGEGAYIIKGDIKKYFYSIDREVLKQLLTKKIKCQKALRLFYKIIDSADKLGPLGLPLGNTTSQLSANIYLNELDQFCKRELAIKYYVRYMDDFFIMCRGKSEANRILALIKEFVAVVLHLELNKDKTKIFPVNQGVNAIGYKIYPTHMLLRNDSKKKIKRKTKAMPGLIRDGKLSVVKAEQMLNSWKGHAGHASSYNFIKKVIGKNSFIYIKKKGKKATLKINAKKLGVER